jgi:hypothetical protein
MDFFFQQMEQMAQKQMGLNQQTQDLLNKGQLSMEQQAAMARLAAEQEALRKMVEELAKSFGRRSDILGRMEGMNKDMEEVVKDLQKNVSRETIRRQERILNRLLDAQQSVRRRDFSRRRQSRTGVDIVRPGPASLPRAEDREDQLRRDILRIAKEGYTQDYQKVIRKYFELLMRKRNITNELEKENK